jgi:hypothetical protein
MDGGPQDRHFHFTRPPLNVRTYRWVAIGFRHTLLSSGQWPQHYALSMCEYNFLSCNGQSTM